MTRHRIAAVILGALGVGLGVAAWYLAIFSDLHLIALGMSAAGLVMFFAAVVMNAPARHV